MTMPPGEGDRTLPSPSRGGGVAGGEPTVPAGGGPPPGGPPPPVGAGGPTDRGALLLLGGSTLAGLVLGALLALVVGNGGSGHPTATTASSTTSTSTTSTSTTTSTTTPAGPQILSFSATPTSPSCLPGSTVQLSWQVQNAVSVAISDNGSSIGTFQPANSRTVAFHCPPTGHTFRLTATSSGGRQASQDVTVTGTVLPSTSTASSTTTT